MPSSTSSFGGGVASVGGSFGGFGGGGGFTPNRLGMGGMAETMPYMPMQMPQPRAMQPQAPGAAQLQPAPQQQAQTMPYQQAGNAPSPYALMAQQKKAATQPQPAGPPTLIAPQGGQTEPYQAPTPEMFSLMSRSFG